MNSYQLHLRRNALWMLWGLLLPLCLSCTDWDSNTLLNAGGKKNMKLTLSFGAMEAVNGDTRAEAGCMALSFNAVSAQTTRSTEESLVNNLCVFQFSGTTGTSDAILLNKFYVDRLSATDGSTINISLSSSTSCFICACANVGDLTGDFTEGTSTYQNLMNTLYTVGGQDSLSERLPMSGVSGTIDTETDDVQVTLYRMVAKITFICDLSALPSGATFVPTGAALHNVPASVSCMPQAAGTLTTTTTTDTYICTDITADAQKTTYGWYMPENQRGTGTNTVSSWAERIEANAPDYATYIELRGNYTPRSGSEAYSVTYIVYLGNGTDMNNYDISRNYHYVIKCYIRGVDLVDSRLSAKTYLSSGATANCYMASETNKIYTFDGTVRGNGNAQSFSTATDVTIPKDKISDAVIVWQTDPGLITAVTWDDLAGQVMFTTGSVAKGNAVIAVRDASNTILWSWHIWVTDYNPDIDDTYTLNNGVTDYVFMDRNLGATCNTSSDAGVCGLLYQWGRKDPFPGINDWNITSQTNPEIAYYNGATTLSAMPVTSNTGIAYSIEHPDEFIAKSGWMYPCSSADSVNHSYLWNSVTSGGKTIYDPCPKGWRVPAFYTSGTDSFSPWRYFNGFLLDTDNSFQNTENTNYVASRYMDGSTGLRGWNFANNSNNTSTYYPVTGYRDRASGVFGDVQGGSYWSATAFSLKGSMCLYLYSSFVSSSNIVLIDAVGCAAIRCVRE